ncbi:hypothetical protein [Glacieibacterium sp.]|uniref:hypothetical protein n=1 Tax=Glacieibacterium sp. TaxID=2860237 RepID=UPI003B00529C
MYRPILFTGMALLMSTVAVANTGAGFHKKTLGMTPETIAAATVVEDDALESKAVLSTQYAPTKGKKRPGQLKDRAYLKAVVDKASGVVSYEVQQIIHYPGDQREYSSAQYLAPAGLRQVELTDARHGIQDCTSNDQYVPSCTRTKYVGFAINEADLKAIAATYRVGDPGNFTFKFKESSGVDYTSGLVAAEVAGLLKAVANYQQSISTAVAPPSS